MNLKDKVVDHLEDSVFMVKFHGWATVVWFMSSVPVCILLSTSVPFLVFLSVYAVVTGHFSSWQAARTECLQKEQMMS